MSSFLQIFEHVVAAARFRYVPSPAELLTQWRDFVRNCAEGYWYGLDEYFNDLSVRDLIERVMTSEQLRDFPEMEEFRASVAAIDEEFRGLLLDTLLGKSSDPWWRRGVLARAGDEYANDAKISFGVDVERF